MASVLSARERGRFWATLPSKALALAWVADVLTGTLLTFAGLPDLTPLPWWQMLAVLGYAMIPVQVADTLHCIHSCALLAACSLALRPRCCFAACCQAPTVEHDRS
jgi:hypothetical protein